MNQSAIYKFCKELGCCDICCLRYLGIRNSNSIENAKQYCVRFQEFSTAADTSESTPALQETTTNANGTEKPDATKCKESSNGSESPPAKRRRTDICISCLGLLQEDGWPDCNRMVRQVLDRKNYDSANFACALSSPIAAILREKAVALRLEEAFPGFDPNYITPLKEAWKWSYGTQLGTFLKMALDSGAVSPLLITLNMEYPDDLQELEILKTLSPDLFASRSKQRRRFTVEFTRRSVEQALEGATLRAMRELAGWDNIPRVDSKVSCVSVACAMAPLYLGGRYIKLTRTLPQTPWMVGGMRMMESSVQEIIFEPLAKTYKMSEADADHRLKFMSAGREDVDVRCLGDGRPFAVEITDPRRELTEAELKDICDKVSAGGQVALTKLVPVTKEELSQLKTGEESKCKTYEALCIKLTHSKDEQDTLNGDAPVTVTDDDIQKINSYRNTPPGDEAVVLITQKTPIRVLHRRPLLSRQRLIFEMHAEKIPDHPQLFALRIRTSAGAYVKEFVHGELRRTTPSLGAALTANVDILALDVTSVHLDWPDK